MVGALREIHKSSLAGGEVFGGDTGEYGVRTEVLVLADVKAVVAARQTGVLDMKSQVKVKDCVRGLLNIGMERKNLRYCANFIWNVRPVSARLAC